MTARPGLVGAITMGYLKAEWGDVYVLSKREGTYTARAVTGRHDVRTSDSPAGLLAEMRRQHTGTKADLCST
jgi:hypothetical protein